MTWGEIILKGLEAGGLKSDSDQVKKFLATNTDLGKLEFKPEEVGDTLLMTMDHARANVGLKNEFTGKVEEATFGAFARDTENYWKKIAEKHGVDSSILSDRNLKPWERVEKVKDLILEKETAALKEGKKGLPEDERKALEKQLADIKAELNGQIEAEKSGRVQEVTALRTSIKRGALVTKIKEGEFGKLSKIAMDFAPSIADQILADADYEFQFDDNKGWEVIDRKTKSVATDKVGKALDIKGAASKYVKEEWLDKGNGNGGSGGNGGNGDPGANGVVLTPAQKQKIAEMNKVNGL